MKTDINFSAPVVRRSSPSPAVVETYGDLVTFQAAPHADPGSPVEYEFPRSPGARLTSDPSEHTVTFRDGRGQVRRLSNARIEDNLRDGGGSLSILQHSADGEAVTEECIQAAGGSTRVTAKIPHHAPVCLEFNHGMALQAFPEGDRPHFYPVERRQSGYQVETPEGVYNITPAVGFENL